MSRPICPWTDRCSLLGTLLLLCCSLLLGGCASRKYTVDDGRPVNETLLGNIKLYGLSEQQTRPAILRSAELRDRECDKQWELPISVVSSQSWDENDRVAWARALGVDERLTVVAALPKSPLRQGDRIINLGGYASDNAELMSNTLVQLRDFGRPFLVHLADGRQETLVPFQVCRGYTRFAPPNTPRLQDYHWLMSMHPLELSSVGLTDDEVLWTVLWTQGLSEEGGLRMKAFDYTTRAVGTLYNLFTLASGLKGAALAAEAAVAAAQNAALTAATELAKQQLIEQARSYAALRLREGATEAAQKLLNQQAVNAMQQAAVNRGALGGVARVGATVFDQADAWAFDRMTLLGGNPLAGFTLHQKLLEQGLAGSAFLFDIERLSALSKRAEARGLGEAVGSALSGLRVAALEAELSAMPLASATGGFSYEDPIEPGAGRFSNGLIDASMGLPIESRK